MRHYNEQAWWHWAAVILRSTQLCACRHVTAHCQRYGVEYVFGPTHHLTKSHLAAGLALQTLTQCNIDSIRQL
jgi:hypothetical protein